jgi:hypothetical protein
MLVIVSAATFPRFSRSSNLWRNGSCLLFSKATHQSTNRNPLFQKAGYGGASNASDGPGTIPHLVPSLEMHQRAAYFQFKGSILFWNERKLLAG